MFRFFVSMSAIAVSASGALAADRLTPFPYYPAPVPAPQIAPAQPPQAFCAGDEQLLPPDPSHV